MFAAKNMLMTAGTLVGEITITGANSSATTSVTIPSHNIGDMLVIFAFKDSGLSAPTKPGASGTVPAWVTIDDPGASNGCAGYTSYFIATATNTTSGTWTNATGMAAVVLSGVEQFLPIGGHALSGGSATNSATAPAITMTTPSGTGAVLEFYGSVNASAWGAAPSGYVSLTSTGEVCCNNKSDTTSDGSIAQTNTATSGGYQGATVEIVPTGKSPLDSPVGYNSALTGSSLSWTHTVANATGADVFAVVTANRNGTTIGVTCDGGAMTQLAALSPNNTSANGLFGLYHLAGVSSGAHTILASFSGTSASEGHSFSYTSVASVGSAVTTFGTGTSLSQSATCGPNQRILQCFGATTTSGSPSWSATAGGIARFNSPGPGGVLSNFHDNLVNTTFTATPSTSLPWAGIYVVLS